VDRIIPNIFFFVPVFSYPIVEVFTLFEIGAEATASARRNAVRAQHRHVKKREVPADTDLPLVGRSRYRERPAVARYESSKIFSTARMCD
jgi:hypothetical protein